MYIRLAKRFLLETDKRLLWKLFWNAGIKGIRSIHKHKRRLKRGEFFPPFLDIPVPNSFNFRCQGCWVDVAAPREMIDRAAMQRLIGDAKRHGNAFFGLLGGEPFLHPELLDILADHPDAYFQVFTNGQMITEKVAARLRELGNVSPLVSIEGREVVSDERRGGKDVLNRTLRGLENCLQARLLTGVATSVCASNIDELCTEAWLDELIRRGVHYVWFHGYRPVGPKISPDLALRPDPPPRLLNSVAAMRARNPIASACPRAITPRRNGRVRTGSRLATESISCDSMWIGPAGSRTAIAHTSRPLSITPSTTARPP